MLTRWQIRPAATAKDPKRRLLLVKGTWTDVHSLIRRLGPVCGRPKKEASDPDYNYSIVLHRVSDSALAGFEASLGAMTSPAAAPARTPTPLPLPKTLSPSGAAEPREPAPGTPAVPAEPAAPPAPSRPTAPPPSLPTAAPEPAPPAEAPLSPGWGLPIQPAAPPAQGAQPAPSPFKGFGATPLPFERTTASEPLSPAFEFPAAAPKGGAQAPGIPDLMAAAHTPDPVPLGDVRPPGPGGLTLSKPPETPAPPQPAQPLQPPPGPTPWIEPVSAPPPPPAAPEPAPVPMGTPVPAPITASPASASEPLFGALKGLDTERTLDNLVVGSYNRFAHAAAMSLLTSPGSLYNPLVVWGGPGSGKTHLVNALALRLQEQAPHETVWATSGALLARAAGLAQASGRTAELVAFAAKARALVIDDLHMTGVAEHNREALEQVVRALLGAGKQVVLGSLYAPRHIAQIEQALGLRTDKTHVVELKSPNDAAQQSIGEAALARLGLAVSAEEKDLFARGLLKDFTALDDHLRRLSALTALGNGSAALAQHLRELFAPDAEPAALSAEQVRAATPKVKEGKGSAILCHPPGGEAHAGFLWGRLYETAKARGWPFPWRAAAKKAYPIDPPHAAPYLLAEDCLRAGASAVVIVGPVPGTDLAGQERPFRAAAVRLLAEAGLSAAFVPFARVQDPKQALLAALDLAPRRGDRP